MATPLHISGLASGLDTDSIVKDLMKVEQLKVDRQFRSKASLEWKRDAYTEVNDQLKSFREKYFSVLNSSSNMTSSLTYSANKVSLSSNTALDITATGSAFAKSLSIASVKKATSAIIESDLKGQSRRAMLSASGNVLAAKTEGELTAIDSGELSLAMNDAAFTDAEGKNIFGFSDTVSTVSFKINDKQISLTSDMTVAQAMEAVNSSGAGVTMSFNEGKFSIVNTAGSDTGFTLAAVSGTPLGSGTGFGIAAGTVSPTSAVVKGTSTLAQLASAQGKTAADTISFSVNGKTFSFASSASINDVLSAVNADETANATMRFDEGTGTFAIASDTAGTGTSISVANAAGNFFGSDGLTKIAAGSASSYSVVSTADSLSTAAFKMGKTLALNADGKFEVSVAGKSFTFAPTATVKSMADTINSAGLGVTLNYSQIADNFIFTANETGASSSVSISGFESLGISTTSANGTDAQIVFSNGDKAVQSSNTFTLDGIQFSIKADYSETTPITATITKDVDGIVQKIKDFITDYNKLVESLSGKLSEKKDYDYFPLTDAEKEEMSDDEIASWEKKAKTGILHSDTKLTQLMSDLRTSMYDVVEGVGLKPIDLGFSTSTWSTSGELQKGQIQLNSTAEAKLREMIQKDPDALTKALSNRSTDTDATTKYKNSGFFVRLSDKINSYVLAAQSGTIKSTKSDISTASTKLNDLTDKMQEKEEQYYRKFSKLESAMSKMSSQSSWLSSQLGALS